MYFSQHIGKRQIGFTLIEMVVTLVIVGILGVGITNFIGRSVQGYSDAAERQQLATIAWIVSEKVSRELREALPNSISLSNANTCVGIIPTLAGSDYLSVPIATASDNFEVVPFSNYDNADVSGERAAIYPNTLTNLYSLSNPGMISDLVDNLSAGTTTGAITVNLDSTHRFITDSPTKRVYMVQNPITYCFESDGFLYRYSGYGFQQALPSNGFTRTVVGSNLSNGLFAYTAGTLSRSGVITLSFNVVGDNTGGNATSHPITQEVQIRNVP